MILQSEMPVLDANGKRLDYGDLIMDGMRVGDPRGWTQGVLVRSLATNEVFMADAELPRSKTECWEAPGDIRLRGLVEKGFWRPEEAIHPFVKVRRRRHR